MSNLSAALHSLSSSSAVDIYLRLRPHSSPSRRFAVSRIRAIGWTVVLLIPAILSRTSGRVIELGLAIASVAYGFVLGVFVLGVLTHKANESGAIAGIIFGFTLSVMLWLQPQAIHFSLVGHAFSFPRIAWTWHVVLGSLFSFLAGYLASYFFPFTQTP